MRVARLAGLVAVGLVLAIAVANRSGSANSTSASRTRATSAPANSAPTSSAQLDSSTPSQARLSGIHKIRHVVIIMQENRSFDSYFGTSPGADGIPGLAGHRGKVPCLPDPGEHCVRPFHDRQDSNGGGPYSLPIAEGQIDGGKMDGFIKEKEIYKFTSVPDDDVMGYHTAKEIPNYCKYAHDFALQDHMFGSVVSWSLPSHLFLTALWSARCTQHNNPASCTNAPNSPAYPPGWLGTTSRPVYACTDLTYLLHKHHVSWRYYMFNGTEPLCDSDLTLSCAPATNRSQSYPIW